MFIIKYLKSLLYILISIIAFGLFITILNYFNIISTNTCKYFKIISIIISFIIGGLYIGKRSSTKGYLEGLKISLSAIAILILLNYLGFDKSFSFKSIIFYIIIIISSVLGSITGINRRKAK